MKPYPHTTPLRPTLWVSFVSAGTALLCAHTVAATAIETVTVTASRSPQSLSELAASLSVVEASELALISATHASEALARVPGVWIARGNGQEHLTAIRSAVLTGAGSCGAFAITEDGIPVRATGFCNVNQLFDINTEQAQKLEVLRGPGTVLHGSDAQHGVINVITPNLDQPSRHLGLEAGANDYARLTLAYTDRVDSQRVGVYLNAAHDGGYKDDAGFGQQKLSLRHNYDGADVSVRTLFSATNLNQETAGYLVGSGAYKDAHRKRENPNPEAYRDSQSVRLQAQFEWAQDDRTAILITPYARYTNMQFMMHFLPGTPVEQNGHKSLGLQSTYLAPLSDALDLTAGVDAEFTQAWLSQTQSGGFSVFPSGKHYDYTVHGLMGATFASLTYQFSERTRVNAGLRYELLQYRYRNQMISGDTAEDGSECVSSFTGATGCRYSRPEDSRDRFDNLSANAGLTYQLASGHSAYTRITQSHRAPQATEMYRLQNGQTTALLDAETIRSLEFGFRGQWNSVDYSATAFYMAKQNVIFQSADRLNINGGKTQHRGLEYDISWQLTAKWSLALAGTLAEHRYGNNVSAPGSQDSLQTKGNQMVSAPKAINTLRLGWEPNNKTQAELEWLTMGSYYTNLDNSHNYGGHALLNLRATHQLNDTILIGARIKNLANIDYAERADFSAFDGDRYFVGEPRSLFLNVELRY